MKCAELPVATAPVGDQSDQLTHALVDEVAPALASEGDDTSLAPVAAAAAVGSGTRLPAQDSGSVSARSQADAGNDGGGGAAGGSGVGDGAMSSLGVSSLLAARVPVDQYGGVTAAQHSVDARELLATAPVLDRE